MSLDLTNSTTNTSGGVRGRLQLRKGQDHYQIRTEIVTELEERGFIVLDKNDLVDAVTQLLLSEKDKLTGLLAALNIPQISEVAGNQLKAVADGWFVAVPSNSADMKMVTLDQQSSGANLIFNWTTPFTSMDYAVNLNAISAATAWSYHIVNQTLTSIEIDLTGISALTTFRLVAQGK